MVGVKGKLKFSPVQLMNSAKVLIDRIFLVTGEKEILQCVDSDDEGISARYRRKLSSLEIKLSVDRCESVDRSNRKEWKKVTTEMANREDD